jgi:DNA-binding transcriptional LysR family regulator
LDLNEIVVFARVVQAGSFTAAARQLELPKSTVSRRVADLEERLGARLLQRTTRRLSLTDVGQTYYQHAARVLAELEAAELAVTRLQEVPRGLLRITMPLNFGHLGPAVSSFLERYPEVEVEVVCADRIVDLVQEGFDLAVRAGPLADSTLVARSLGAMRRLAVASPAFVSRYGAPKEPEELAGLPCVVFGADPSRTRWSLQSDERIVSVTVRPRLTVNDFDFLDEAARAGLGVAMIPDFRCVAPLRSRHLVRLLPDWSSPGVPVHAVYPSTRHLSPKVTAFLEHLRTQLGGVSER